MTRWTLKQYTEHLGRKNIPFQLPANEPAAFGRGRLPVERMNKLESAYSAYLETRKLAGEILWHKFQYWRLRLADGAWYTPDFSVLHSDGILEAHETKGFWREAARVRIKVAASLHPFRFIAVKKSKSGWDYETF